MKRNLFNACAAMMCSALLAVGCSSTSVQQRAHEQAVERAESQMANVPDWFLEPPEASQDAIYGVGSSFSADLQNAVRKASLQANYEIAQTYQQRVSGSERAFIRESGINEQGGVQAEVVQKKVLQEGTGFRAYVLARYKMGTNNLIKQEVEREHVVKSTRQAADDAYQELESRVEQARKGDNE